MNITFEFACQDDCLDKMVPSDLRKIVRERDELRAERDQLKAKIKEEAYEAYWEASDSNRADRWAEHFDDSVRVQFEKYWNDSHKVGA